MFKYKIEVMPALKEAGYTAHYLTHTKPMTFGQATLQKFRVGEKMPSWDELDRLCKLLKCQPWDIVEYVPDPEPTTAADDKKEG